MKYKITVFIVALVILVLDATYFLGSYKEPSNENRTMATFQMVTEATIDSVAYRESAIERFEEAMKDQFFFRSKSITFFADFRNTLTNTVSSFSRLFYKKDINQYSYEEMGNYIRIDGTDWISEKPDMVEIEVKAVQPHVDLIEKIHNVYPEIGFYVYFVTQGSDTGWFDNFLGTEVPDKASIIFSCLPNYVSTGMLEYEDLEDYKACHYKSDHHWNENGSRRGYENIYNLMKNDLSLSPVLTPNSKLQLSELYDFRYKGSYAKNLGDLYSEFDEFSVYKYDLPKYNLSIIDPETDISLPVTQMSLWKEYQNGKMNKNEYTDHYIQFYGNAEDADGNKYADSKYIFHIENTEVTNGHNLLITGDSYNRAIRDLVAAHFANTIYVDYRIMSKIEIDKLITENDIDTILISGYKGIWTSNEYLFKWSVDEGGSK